MLGALREKDAYPAMPEDGYGWEKLFSERMCRNFHEDFGIETRVARYHNVYGPHGTYAGGREKAPAAICRKVAEAKLADKDEIEIWGDGGQTRSFMYIDDCLYGTTRIMESDIARPDQPRLVGTGHDQPAGRHRRGDRRSTTHAPLQPRRAQGRPREEFRQHVHPGAARLGAQHAPLGGTREDVRLDLRRDGHVFSSGPPARPIRLMSARHPARTAPGQ